MGPRGYTTCCLFIGGALVAVKLWLAAHVPTTALFSDDHEYLNRSAELLRGNFSLAGYPFSGMPYGPLYPLVVSPWTLFTDPAAKLMVVFGINAVLSAATVFFGSLTVFRLTGATSVLVPVCLAVFPPLFQTSFYAMSENLLFPLLAFLGWVVVDFDRVRASFLRSVLAAIAVLLIPLVRVPGLAVVPGLALLAWANRDRLLRSRAEQAGAALFVIVPVLSYCGFYRLVANSTREAGYIASLAAVVSDPGVWWLPVRLVIDQTAYLFFSTGYWVVPTLLVLAMQVCSSAADGYRRRWINYLVYAAASGASFLFFAVVHLIQKQRFGDRLFIYGRYDDPAGLLFLIGGLAALFALRPLTKVQSIAMRVAAPLALWWVLTRVGRHVWTPVNQCGLAIFAARPWSLQDLAGFAVLGALLSQLVHARRWYVPAALVFFVVFSLMTDAAGMRYTINRARVGAYSVEGAEWIVSNTSLGARVGYDARIMHQRAPVGVRKMVDVYRAMAFRTYPRKAILVGSARRMEYVDYLYTAITARPWQVGGREPLRVWTNGAYVLYRIPRRGVADSPTSTGGRGRASASAAKAPDGS